MAMVDTGRVRLHVQRLAPPDGGPAAGTVVLLHGMLTDSLASWYFTAAPALAAAGWDVVMYDLRGHGRSERTQSGYGLDAFLGDLDTLLDRLAVPGPVHLAGNSFGGTIAFGYAELRPERVASITVIESEPATAAWAEKIRVPMELYKTNMAADEQATLGWIGVHHGTHTARLAKSAKQLVQTTTFVEDILAGPVLTEERIRTIRCPVLTLYGSESSLADGAPWLESLLPRCQTVVLPGLEHSVLIEAPGAVREHLLAWLREQRPAPRLQEADAR